MKAPGGNRGIGCELAWRLSAGVGAAPVCWMLVTAAPVVLLVRSLPLAASMGENTPSAGENTPRMGENTPSVGAMKAPGGNRGIRITIRAAINLLTSREQVTHHLPMDVS